MLPNKLNACVFRHTYFHELTNEASKMSRVLLYFDILMIGTPIAYL